MGEGVGGEFFDCGSARRATAATGLCQGHYVFMRTFSVIAV